MSSVMFCSEDSADLFQPRARPMTQHLDPFANIRPSYTLRYETGMIEKNANPIYMQRLYEQQPAAMEVGRVASVLNMHIRHIYVTYGFVHGRLCACLQDNVESLEEEELLLTPKRPTRSINTTVEAPASPEVPPVDSETEESVESAPESSATMEDLEPAEWKVPKTVRLHGAVS